MRKSFLRKGTAALAAMLVILLFTVSCEKLTKELELPEFESYWQFDYTESEDRELIKGTWILKKVGYEYLDDNRNPYVDTVGVEQTSYIESIHIDFEGKHLVLTYNFDRPVVVEYWNFDEKGSLHYTNAVQTSLTITDMEVVWEFNPLNPDKISILNWSGERQCQCPTFLCCYTIKKTILDEETEISRLIMEDNHNLQDDYDLEFERK